MNQTVPCRKGDTYDTPPDRTRSLTDLCFLRSRWSFYCRNLWVNVTAGRLCRQGRFSAERSISDGWRNVQIVEECGGRFHCDGLNHLEDPRPAVIVGNHMSMLETAVLHAFVRPRRDFCFVIKRSLSQLPYFGDIMRFLGCIPVDRENPRDDFKTVMEEGVKRLREGKSVILFPQHTRNSRFVTANFNTIGVKLARHAGVPVIPLALKTDFMANGRWIKDLGPLHPEREIRFSFGAPIEIASPGGKAEQAAVIEYISSHLRKWGVSVE